MDKTIKVSDRNFKLYLTAAQIQEKVKAVAERINQDLVDKDPIFVAVLNGSFIYAADLFRNITIPDCEITFVRLKSYAGTQTTGEVRTIAGLNESVVGRNVVIIEDIVDSGYTMARIVRRLKEDLGANEVYVSCLLSKPNAIKVKDLKLDYVAMEIPNDFIVGYGLDYNEKGRNLPDIWVVTE